MMDRLRKRKQHFAMIANAAARDERLSAEARGTLAYLLSLDEGFTIRMDVMRRVMNCGKEKLTRIVKELEAFGYVERTARQLPNGRLNGYDWHVTDEPHREMAHRDTGNPAGGDHRHHKKINLKNTNEEESPINPPEGEALTPQQVDRSREGRTLFDAFWSAYPLRKHEGNREKVELLFWRTVRGEREDLEEYEAKRPMAEELIAAARAYATSPEADDPRFVASPMTFLRECRWSVWLEEDAHA